MPNGLLPGYPKKSTDERGTLRTYVYKDLYNTLSAQIPVYKSIYLKHPVEHTSLERIGVTTWGELTIVTLQAATATDGGASFQWPEGTEPAEAAEGTKFRPDPPASGPANEVTDDEQYPFFEVDWVQVEKSLRQHPAFSGFTVADWNAIDLWEKETDGAARAAFQYYLRDSAGTAVGSVQTLSTDELPDKSPQTFAKLRLLGVDSFLDFAPVFRKTSRFVGNEAPATSDAGQKDSSPSGAPSGYEWLKTADRSSKQGLGVEWIRQEEWTGARLILLDKDEVFIT